MSRNKRVLFVCTANLQRSVTAAELYSSRSDLEVRSAGTDPSAIQPITKELTDWADEIYVMESYHQRVIVRSMPDSASKIRVLSIPDMYWRNDPSLIELLIEKLTPHLGPPDKE